MDHYAEVRVFDESVTPEMVWVDIETTGLQHPGEGRPDEVPLELGCVVTDLAGNKRAGFQHLVRHPSWHHMISTANEYVQNMHQDNGLTQALTASELNATAGGLELLLPHEVDLRMRDFMLEYAGEPQDMPLCGSTINFDRFFLAKFFPASYGWFHYRNIDVSTLMGLCQRLNKPLIEARPPYPRNKSHRVIGDIEASISDYQWYLNNFLVTSR